MTLTTPPTTLVRRTWLAVAAFGLTAWLGHSEPASAAPPGAGPPADEEELVLEEEPVADAEEPVADAGEPVAGEPVAGEPVAGEPVADELVAGAGEPVADAGEPVAGEPVADAPIDAAAYAKALREQVALRRGLVVETLSERMLAAQDQRMGIISTIFSIVSILGLGLLLMPLLLRKRYPGQGAVLWKYSALATLIFVLTINLFAGVFAVLRTAQMVAGQATNPQLQLVDATFDVIDEKAEDLAEVGPLLIEPTLMQLDGSSDEPLPVLMLENLQTLRNDLTVFQTVATFFKGISGVFGYVPVVLSLVTVTVFLLGLRQTLTDIVRLPIAAAAGEAGAARRVLGATLRRVGRELLVTLGVMVVLVVVLLLAGLLMAEAIRPAMEAFLAYLMVSFMYLQAVPGASTGVVMTSLVGSVLFLVLDLVVVIAASALFVGKVHKILQRRLHDREPLRAHGRFWRWGLVSLAWALAFPLVYILVGQPAVEMLIDASTTGESIAWGMLLISGPLVLVLGFVILLWAAQGLRALGFLAKYKVPKLGSPVSGATFEVQMPGVRTPEGGIRTGATQAVASLGGVALLDDEARGPGFSSAPPRPGARRG